jgi:hypothetical protein
MLLLPPFAFFVYALFFWLLFVFALPLFVFSGGATGGLPTSLLARSV